MVQRQKQTNKQNNSNKSPPFSCYRITYIAKCFEKKKGKNGKAQEQRDSSEILHD